MPWKCVANKSWPLLKQESWDGAAAKEKIFEWAGWPENPNASKARRCFLAYDSDNSENKGAYKLPFVWVVDGEPKASNAGVNAAASRLPNTDIPQSVKDDARSVIDYYQNRFEEEEDRFIVDKQNTILYTPMRVRDQTSLSNDALFNRLLLRIGADYLSNIRDRVAFIPAEISSTRLDAYFTHMTLGTLKNFANQANEGISFQDSHNVKQLGIGYSLSGSVEMIDEPVPTTIDGANVNLGTDSARAVVDFYTVKGLKLGSNFSYQSTDDFLAALEAGLVRDVSVGFYGGTLTCDICGNDFFSTDCVHWPGTRYPMKNASGDITGEVLSTLTIDNANLAEVSAVYDGATPGAGVIKAQRMADAGLLEPKLARKLEKQYRIALPQAREIYRGIDSSTTTPEIVENETPSKNEGEVRMDPIQVTEETLLQLDGSEKTMRMGDLLETIAEMNDLRERLEQDVDVDEDAERAIAERDARIAELETQLQKMENEAANDENEQEIAKLRDRSAKVDELERTVSKLSRRVEELKPLAEQGEAYRADLVEDALAAGVRAYGNDFNRDVYATVMEKITLDAIKRMRDDWNKFAQSVFQSGRASSDDPEYEHEEIESKSNQIPDDVYRIK